VPLALGGSTQNSLGIIPDPSPLLREGVWTAHRVIGGNITPCGAKQRCKMQTYFGFAIADSMFPYSAECTIRRRELDADTVRAIVADGVIPCLNPSHKATIDAMRTRFGIDVPIPETPPRVELQNGDRMIVMGVRGLPRLTDRHEYTAEEIEGAEFRFSEYRIYNVVKACPPGWQTFRFRSMWDGSVGDGQDLDVLFYFRPGLDIGGWEIIDTHGGFIHRFRGGNEAYESFTSWLESLQEGVDFINAEDILV